MLTYLDSELSSHQILWQSADWTSTLRSRCAGNKDLIHSTELYILYAMIELCRTCFTPNLRSTFPDQGKNGDISSVDQIVQKCKRRRMRRCGCWVHPACDNKSIYGVQVLTCLYTDSEWILKFERRVLIVGKIHS